MDSVDKENGVFDKLQPKDISSSSGDNSSSSSMTSDENKERGNWTGRLDFLLSCIGYAVGLGNIWRFPYLCYRNGGGAFLIPYITFLILCGMPLVLLEISYGQFANLSPITVWKMSPFFKGIGYGMVIISGMVCIYYNIIITWTLYYLFMSFTSVLPWSTCDNDWNDERCALRGNTGNATNATLANVTMFGYSSGNFSNNTLEFVGNITTNVTQIKKQTPSEQYWQKHVLDITSGIEDMGEVRWQLCLCLLLAWVVVFLCLFKGVKSSGKVVYVTATFPYLVLIILMVRGVTLPGSATGIYYYLVPQWHKLASFKVWGEAATQIFYSVGAAWGGLITMASYNKFNNNVLRDAIVVPIINCGTSIFAGLVIFSIIGFMAHETGVNFHDVVNQGPGLIFVVYPEAISKLPISPLWAVLFFLMIFTLGLDSQFGMFETMTSAFVDEFPNLLRNRKTLFTAVVCMIEFLLGIAFITKGGIYLLQIMDWYSSAFSLMILSFLECVAIAYAYGVDRFCDDIQLMIGRRPPFWYKISWMAITPFTIMFILIFTIVMHEPVTYGSYSYPTWALIIGWAMALVSIIPLPVIMIIECLKQKGTLLQRIKKAMQPAHDWGPAPQQHREAYLASLAPSYRENYSAEPLKPGQDEDGMCYKPANGNTEAVLLRDWKPVDA